MRHGKLVLVAALLGELLLLLPVWLTADALLPERLRTVWLPLPPLAAAFGAWAGGRWNRVWQLGALALAVGGAAFAAAVGLAGAFGFDAAAAGGAATGGPAAKAAWTIAGATALAALTGATAAGRAGHVVWHWAGLGLYFVAAIAFPRIEALASAVPALTAGGVAALAVALYATNAASLKDATLAGSRPARVPAALRSHNGLFVGALLVGVVALTALFGNAFGRLLYHLVRSLLLLLAPGEPEEAPAAPPAPAPAPAAFPPAEGEPSWWARLLDWILYALAISICAALAAAAAYWLYKHGGERLRRLWAIVAALLGRTVRPAEGDGFRDEEVTLFSWEAGIRSWKDGWLGRRERDRRERWEEMRTNRDKARFLYRRLLREAVERGYEPRADLTPKETIGDLEAWAEEAARSAAAAARGRRRPDAFLGDRVDPLLRLYYRARYAGEEPRDEEVERLRRRLDEHGPFTRS